MPKPPGIRLLCVTLICCLPLTSSAVALRAGKASDDTVCDLAPYTTYQLGTRVLIPVSVPSNLQAEALLRAGARFVAANCTNSQLLILQGAASMTTDVNSMTNLANWACPVAGVSRTSVLVNHTSDSRTAEQGFELRCTITKLPELRAKLAEMEARESNEAFFNRLADIDDQLEGPNRSRPVANPKTNKDCGKLSVASILFGGSKDCPPPLKP